MWDEENSAETVTIHPWAGASQPQAWQGMNRGVSNNSFVPGNRGNQQPQQRSWDPSQQQQQMPPPGSGWTPQMTWNPMASHSQPSNNWLPQQQWSSSNSSSGTYAEKAKNSSGIMNRMSGGPLSLANNNSTRFDQMSAAGTTNWASGSVKVDQQTPWDTTGSGGHSHNSDSREWNAGLSSNVPGPSGATRWGQPASVGIPPGAPNVWPQTGVVNTSNTISGAGNATEWTQNPTIIASVQNAHRIPPQHDITGTAHWSAGAPPPAILMGNGAVGPSVTCGSSGNWCGIGGGPGGSDINRLPYDPNPQTPGPWVAPQPAEMNNDMMWHDPNPKQKKVQRDIGTSVWGDPSTQRGDIRRWKEADQVPEYSAPPNGSDWSNLPLNVSVSVSGNNFSGVPTPVTGNNNENVVVNSNGNNNIINCGNPVSSSVTGSGWGEPTQPNNPNIDMGTSRWGANGNLSNGNNGSGLMWSSQQPEKNDDVMSADALIQAAASRNLINVSAFSSAALAANPHLLLDLNNLLQRYFSKERELNKIQQLGVNRAPFKNEEERLICEIKNVKSELAEIQCNMSNSVSISTSNISNGSHNGSLPQDGQSRLQQWKKTNNLNNNISGSNSVDSNSDLNSGNIQTILAVTQTLSIYSSNNSTGGLDDKSSSDWKSGTLDWSAPSTIGSGEGFEKGPSSSGNNSNFNGGENSSENATTNAEQNPLVDDGPPEFVPGKKWEWRDPNKVAEDPNATPGTCKPNPLLSSALQHPLAGTSLTSVISANTMNNDMLKAWSNNLSGGSTSTEMWNKHRISSINGPPPPINRMLNGMPPPNMVNFNSTNRQFSPAFSGFWFLFQLMNFSEHQLMQICNRVGRLLNFLVVGQKIACAKFAEANIEVILQRLKSECINLQQQVKLVTDEEFDKMMRSNTSNNIQIVNRFPFINSNETQQHQHWANDMISMAPPPLSHFGAGNDFSSGIPF